MYDKQWYQDLNKSSLTPPDKVFGIVWPLLYISLITYGVLTGIDEKCVGFCTPLIFFTIQMVLNLCWTTIFFKLRMLKTAFIIILVMITLTIFTMYETWNLDMKYFYILIPYLLWISFASYLNGYIVFNN
tara:strand:- start:74 stop:463 length:390 start_codon:yes stop_codon:yes gene_type:complete